MIRDIENYSNDDLIEVAHQITTELSNRSELDSVIHVTEITDYQEYLDGFIIDLNSEEDIYGIVFTKEQIIELRTRLNQTNY